MMPQAQMNDVSRACRVLFGSNVRVTPEFLGRLRPCDLKNTYHRRALEFHPDRASFLGRDPEQLTEVFKDVNLAYEVLRGFLSKQVHSTTWIPMGETTPQRTSGARGRKRSTGNAREEHSPCSDHFWQSSIPDMKLLFGQYLYYAGVISWRTLISAINWQRQQRPTFGRIAQLWDYLGDEEIAAIISSRLVGERLGDAALRMGYMTPYQRNAVLGFQRWLQRPLGSYFTARGLLLEEEVDYLVRLLRRHNASASRRRRFA